MSFKASVSYWYSGWSVHWWKWVVKFPYSSCVTVDISFYGLVFAFIYWDAPTLSAYIFILLHLLTGLIPWSWCSVHVCVLSVPFSHSVVSNSLWSQGLLHARLPVHHQLLKLAQTHDHGVGDAIQPFHPLSSPSPPASIFPSIRVFSSDSVLHIRWPKYWSFDFSISLWNEYSGLISFRIDWYDHLPVQGTLKSLLQHHSSEASILQCSAFFIVQLSHPYMTP